MNKNWNAQMRILTPEDIDALELEEAIGEALESSGIQPPTVDVTPVEDLDEDEEE
jgi:hypothetical protein